MGVEQLPVSGRGRGCAGFFPEKMIVQGLDGDQRNQYLFGCLRVTKHEPNAKKVDWQLGNLADVTE
jgi:hypothetical protein